MPRIDIHLPAVLTAALIALALGALWYSPKTFGRWSAHRASERTPPAYLVWLVCHLVTAVVLTVLLTLAAVRTLGEGLWVSFLAWLGFAAALGLASHVLSADKRMTSYWIDSGYQLASLLLMGAVLTVWH